jgi:hypothetical protein
METPSNRTLHGTPLGAKISRSKNSRHCITSHLSRVFFYNLAGILRLEEIIQDIYLSILRRADGGCQLSRCGKQETSFLQNQDLRLFPVTNICKCTKTHRSHDVVTVSLGRN